MKTFIICAFSVIGAAAGGTSTTVVRPLAPKPWNSNVQWNHMPLYHVMAGIVSSLNEDGIAAALSGGSYLGSMRHHGHVPMRDKDGDLWVFTVNESIIERALRSVKHLGVSWKHNHDGIGANPHTGFGYHVDIEKEARYLDLWLYSHTPQVTCVGLQRGCGRWFAKYMGKPPVYQTRHYFPLVYRPFGPYLMPVPHGKHILLAQFSNTWNSSCMGWQRGDKACQTFYSRYPFVFVNPDGGEVLKVNGNVLQTFDSNQLTGTSSSSQES